MMFREYSSLWQRLMCLSSMKSYYSEMLSNNQDEIEVTLVKEGITCSVFTGAKIKLSLIVIIDQIIPSSKIFKNDNVRGIRPDYAEYMVKAQTTYDLENDYQSRITTNYLPKNFNKKR